MSIATDRMWYFILPFLALTMISIGLTLFLTPVYRSTATISVESQQIPEDLIRSTITSNASERLDYITQRVLTRPRILEIIRTLDLHPQSGLSASQLVSSFRDSVSIETVNANIANSRRTQTISFSLAFDSESPEKAQSVTSELVTMFLDENVRTRSARAAQTTEFLAEEGEKIRNQVNVLEKKVAEFKQLNSAMLPEVHDMNIVLMSRLENEYQGVMLSIEEVESELKVLRIQADQYKNTVSTSGPSLNVLKQRLNELLIQHTNGHPDVIRIRREIDVLESQMLDATNGDQSTRLHGQQMLNDPAFARISIQIDSAERKSSYLNKNRRELRKKLIEIEERISGAPVVERKYVDLQRDLENLQAKYQEIKNKEIEAKISQNLEEDQKGERFSLLEAAIVPTEPESPNRLLILAGGFGAAIALGFALTIGREILNPGVRSLSSFTEFLGAPPLVVIPDLAIQTDDSRTFIKANSRLIALVCCLLAGAAAVLTVAIFLEPLRLAVQPIQAFATGLL